MTRRLLLAAVAALVLSACGGKRILQDPVMNLGPHSRIGLVTFTADNAKGGLVTLATQKFQEQMLQAQPGIEVLELGALTGPVDAAAARRLGDQHGVRTVVVGHLVVSDIKPRIRLISGLSASTEVTLSLSARLLSAESGATVWARSASMRETLHQVSIQNGTAVFDAQDAAEAYGEVVNELVFAVTSDFRQTWVRP